MILSEEITLPLDEQIPLEIQEPYLSLQSLSKSDLENVKTAILVHIKLEKNREILDYWENLLCICEFYTRNQTSLFTEEIDKILKEKDIPGLSSLKTQILQSIDNPTLDRNY